MTTSTDSPQEPHPAELHDRVIGWFDSAARDLPWRRPEATAWGVMVSEFMLQQTPVNRVLGVWESWMARWPAPADLAAAPAGDAVRAWGRLGYPRRALRLHAAAAAITEHHGGLVPQDRKALLALPGVGDYTAAAIASFAYGQREVVLDTNVRRVFARLISGHELPGPTVNRAERELATSLLPTDPATAATWAVATMELGAIVCTAATPRCPACPVRTLCMWRQIGRPRYDGPPRRAQTWAGTDRQCRGRLLGALRASRSSVSLQALADAWPGEEQRTRAMASLIKDGLMVRLADGRYALPG